MKVGTTIIGTAAALISALLLPGAPARAQTISNTAVAEWTIGGAAGSVLSNRVDLQVARMPTTLETFHPVPQGAGSAALPVMNSICAGQPLALFAGQPQLTASAGQDQSATLSATGNGALIVSAETRELRLGETLILRLTAPLANLDPATADRAQVILTTDSGDREQLFILETGPDTGIFTGAIQTRGTPPALVQGDCRLSALSNQSIAVSVTAAGSDAPLVSSLVGVLADPFGLVFDSEDGTPVSGARVTLVDAATGTPASVFADDGVTPWPATVTTGQTVIDGAGEAYPLAAGEYRFPLAPLGEYRLLVEPPAPWSGPSAASPADLAPLARPDGAAFLISDASFGGAFALASIVPVRVDIPVDRPGVVPVVSKTASRARAQPGDAIFYTLTVGNPDTLRAKQDVRVIDTPSRWLRIRPDSVRIDGAEAGDAVSFSPDGSSLALTLDTIPAGGNRRITYAMTVRPDAPPGQALNRAEATDRRGRTGIAEAAVQIETDTIAGRMTIIGRVSAGPCARFDNRPGVAGVRVMLEDGSYAITDADGRYHFEGVVPGTHVVAVQPQTLPEGGEFIDCVQSSRSAGSAVSRFVTGQGGSLAVADFHADLSGYADILARQYEEKLARAAAATEDPRGALPGMDRPVMRGAGDALSDRVAAGADTDWLGLGDGPDGFLFPEAEHNPRVPAVRIVIRHRADQKVDLSAAGEPVDARNFDLMQKAADGSYAVSIWRGVPLTQATTLLHAVIRNADGSVASEHERSVAFTSAPWRAELIEELSDLVADGRTRPLVAVRLTDRRGRPIRSGVTGTIAISDPYESAAMLDQMQLGQLTGQGSGSAIWTVEGDDGIAFIELAPTMVSGPLNLDFVFNDDQTQRLQRLESWVVPGDLDWTLVGLAEGTAGAKSVADQMERSGRFDSDLGDDARVAFYAKGQVLGSFLLTVAYDSAKDQADQRLLGTIDPNAYYTVFADRSDRRFDAVSREKLYVRVEAATFYALYGDFVTGFDQTLLARYQRTTSGIKAEGRFGALHAQGFASEFTSRYRRDEIQGGGITGPYPLTDRGVLANSEQVAIEVRDRFRSEVIVERRELTRFIDYDLDLLAGTITFKEPVLSRDFALNPQFIVVDYEVADGLGEATVNAGARADYTFGDDTLRIGASAISDRGDGARTTITAVDARLRVNGTTEVRAEIGHSRANGEQGGADATAWLVEGEYRTGALDLIGYARQVGAGFGTGQQNLAERGRRKLGVDARYGIGDRIALVASAWHDDSLIDATSRRAVQGTAVYRGDSTDARLGIAHFSDLLGDGTRANSTVLEGGLTQRLLGNRLELSATTSVALEAAESLDLPARHRLRARYALTNWLRLLGTYEIADGETLDARTFNAGVELSPWQGSRFVTTLGQQNLATQEQVAPDLAEQSIGEQGRRSFAAFGLSQSLPVSPTLTLDATLDGNRELGGANPAQVINPAQPAASGGFIGTGGTLFEDFTAATLGAAWRKDRWSATMRGEYRDGEFADRYGLTTGVIRQLGEGVILGGGGSWTQASDGSGTATEVIDAALAAAFRPQDSEFAFLSKLEFRSDRVSNAVAGQTGPVGRTALTVDGDARSQRLIASLSTNWSPGGGEERRIEDVEERFQRSEFALFLAARYNFERIAGFGIEGTTLLAGLDARFGIGPHLEIGGVANVRAAVDDGTASFAFGPQVGFVPTDNMLLVVGYNITGFRDEDFSAARNTDQGIFAAVRMKFDNGTLQALGIGR